MSANQSQGGKIESRNPLSDAVAIMNLLWESLTEVEQDEALAAFWASEDSDTRNTRKGLIVSLADALKFRVIFIERAPLLKKVAFLKKVSSRKPFCYHRDNFVRSWLVEHRRPMLKAFLDGASVPNDNGFATQDDPPTVEQFDAGLAAVYGKFAARDIQVYVIYLAYFGNTSGFWDKLKEAKGFTCIVDAALNDYSPADVEAIEPDEQESEPESNTEGFTTLDDHLIRELVASSFQQEGALGEDAAEDLVEEIVELNASRPRSLFHRGFFHALFERPFTFHFSGENSERRQWYLCGTLFGLLRRNDISQCVEIFAVTQKEIGEEIISSRDTPCGPKLLPLLYQALFDAGYLRLTLRFLSKQLPRIPKDFQRVIVLQGTLMHASKLLRSGKAAEAEPIFDLLNEFIEHKDNLLADSYREHAAPRVKRRKAQCLQAKGSFPAAKAILLEFGEANSNETKFQALTDLALIEGGFRSLAAILPKPKLEQNKPLIESLKRGVALMELAIEAGGESATNAHFCLGLLATLEAPTDLAQKRADRFQIALGGMLEDIEAYCANGILDWTRFLLALALLETAEQSNFMAATDLMSQAIETELRFPAFLWERMFEAATLFDDVSLAIQIGNYLLACREEATDCLIANAALLARSESLFSTVLEKFLSRQIPIRHRWQTLHRLLPDALTHQGLEVAGTILDQMEVLAIRDKEFRVKFIEILKDSDRYSPAWDTNDAHDSLITLLELEGDKAGATEILRQRFFQVRGDGASHRAYEMRQVIERMRDLHGDGSQFEDLEGMLKNDCDELDQLETIKLNGSVLYIGGNETQERYEKELIAELNREHPNLTINLYFPGWDSWHNHLHKIKPMIDRADVIVINSLVRTQLGRHVRSYCNSQHPWLPCTGRGFSSIKESILRAATWHKKQFD